MVSGVVANLELGERSEVLCLSLPLPSLPFPFLTLLSHPVPLPNSPLSLVLAVSSFLIVPSRPSSPLFPEK